MVSGRQSAMLDMLSQGEYSYASTKVTAQNWTVNVVYPTDITDNSAGTADMILSWCRIKLFMQSAATNTMATIVCWKQAPGESTPAWTSSSIQKMRDEGKLFFLKSYWQVSGAVGACREVDMEFYNVKLRVGEELKFGTIVKDSVEDGIVAYVMEKRELTVGVV